MIANYSPKVHFPTCYFNNGLRPSFQLGFFLLLWPASTLVQLQCLGKINPASVPAQEACLRETFDNYLQLKNTKPCKWGAPLKWSGLIRRPVKLWKI